MAVCRFEVDDRRVCSLPSTFVFSGPEGPITLCFWHGLGMARSKPLEFIPGKHPADAVLP